MGTQREEINIFSVVCISASKIKTYCGEFVIDNGNIRILILLHQNNRLAKTCFDANENIAIETIARKL